MLKLASWNVNSLSVRFNQTMDWFDAEKIDILAVQETKLTDEKFPEALLHEKGLYVVFSGQKSYNGVAIISRFPIENKFTDIPTYHDPQRRILAATICGIRIINLYVPNGAAVDTDQYSYKLNWLSQVTEFIKHELQQHQQLAVVGDFNIAPEDCDVHDPDKWQGCVLVSPAEREAFNTMLSLGLHDSFRNFKQAEQCFSWWDYRAGGFRRNHGLRIDHILLSTTLNQACRQSNIDVTPRRSERPSDHAPVWFSLEI